MTLPSTFFLNIITIDFKYFHQTFIKSFVLTKLGGLKYKQNFILLYSAIISPLTIAYRNT